jgi:RNA polymerase sigma-70 factor (ECF subfamily)
MRIQRTGVRVVVAEVGFEGFYRRHFPGAVALAHALAGGRVAEDIAQEAMWATFKKWDELEVPERWLFRVIANRSRSVLRRSYAEARATQRLVGGVRDIVELPEPTEEFWAVVRRLPRRQAQTVALVFVEDLSTADVAEVLGCAEATFRGHLHRARQRLAEYFGAEV